MGSPEITRRPLSEKLTAAPALRWRTFAPALVIIWIVAMADKVGGGVIATSHTGSGRGSAPSLA